MNTIYNIDYDSGIKPFARCSPKGTFILYREMGKIYFLGKLNYEVRGALGHTDIFKCCSPITICEDFLATRTNLVLIQVLSSCHRIYAKYRDVSSSLKGTTSEKT